MLKWQRLRLLLRVLLAFVSEEQLWQALAARFPNEAMRVMRLPAAQSSPEPVVLIDGKRRRWEVYDAASHWMQPVV